MLRHNQMRAANFRLSAFTLAILVGCNRAPEDRLWANEKACWAARYEACSRDIKNGGSCSINVPPTGYHPLADWLAAHIPKGSSLADANRVMQSVGFKCYSYEGSHTCRKDMGTEHFFVSRTWGVAFELDELNGVAGFETNCDLTGF